MAMVGNAPLEDGNVSKKEPLRKPKHALPTMQSQYVEIGEIWRNFRDRVLFLSKENYLSKGKVLAGELQQQMHINQQDVMKVIHLMSERAVKDLYSYPIVALLFEDLGNDLENCFDGEAILNELQTQLQLGLSTLSKKLGNMDKLLGTDVGIVFLFLSLLKLENIRNGDGTFFKQLLTKLFKEFHLYMLGARKWSPEDLSPTVMNAVGMLTYVVDSETDDAKDKMKVKQVLRSIRSFLIHGDVKSIGRVHLQWIIELLNYKQCDNNRDEFYRKRYMSYCNRSNYLIDSLENVLSYTDIHGTCKSQNETSTMKSPRLAHLLTDHLGTLNISKDVLVNKNEKTVVDSSFLRNNTDSAPESLVSTTSDLSQKDNTIAPHTENAPGSRSRYGIDGCEQLNDSEPKIANSPNQNSRENIASIPFTELIKTRTNNESESPREVTECIKVPGECINRIVGYEGAILRKLEYQSNTKIYIEDDDFDMQKMDRPETTSLTAHRLVSGALGISANMDKEKLAAEIEKLNYAKELASRYKMYAKQRGVKIIGCPEAVSAAKTMINDIVNITTVLDVPLTGFTIDDVIDVAGLKLKTVETLLNLILRLEVLEDESVVLHISGDKKSCEDAKKLILEELGQVYSIKGKLLHLPLSLKSILTTKDELETFADELSRISNVPVRILTDSAGEAYLFFNGFDEKVSKAHNVLNKINTRLLFGPIQDNFKSHECEIWSHQQVKTLPELISMMDNMKQIEYSHATSKAATVIEKKRIYYSREDLLQYALCPTASHFPISLQEILDGNDADCKTIISKKGTDSEKILELASDSSNTR